MGRPSRVDKAWGSRTKVVRLVPLNYEGFGIEAYLLRPVLSWGIFVMFLVIVGDPWEKRTIRICSCPLFLNDHFINAQAQ